MEPEWRCEACDYRSQGGTSYKQQQDAEKHWIDYGYPHVVRPVGSSGGE